MDFSKEYFKRWMAIVSKGWKRFLSLLSTAQDVHTELLGMDMEASSVAFVQFRNPFGILRVHRADMMILPVGTIADDVLMDDKLLVAICDKMLKNKGVQAKKSSIAMPSSKVVIRQVPLDHPLNDTEAEARAWHEARTAFPGMVKNIYLDFGVLDQVGADGSLHKVLTIVVVRKEDVMPRTEVMRELGVPTKVVDVDYYALARAYRLLQSQLPADHVNQYVAMIHFDPSSLLMVVMYKKQVNYCNRQTFTGEVLTNELHRFMAKLGNTADYDEALTNLILSEEQLLHIVTRIRRLLQFFYSERQGRTIDRVILSGRCALFSNLTNHLTSTLNIPVIQANPFGALKIEAQENRKRLEALAPAFVLAAGLAMRGLSLWT